MKLWIDDIRSGPQGWHRARTVRDAVRAIEQFMPEEISIDHDISHQVTIGNLGRPYPCEETFEPVARFIAMMSRYQNGRTDEHQIWEPKVTIHSSNPVGAKYMQEILKDVGIFADFIPMSAANRLELDLGV